MSLAAPTIAAVTDDRRDANGYRYADIDRMLKKGVTEEPANVRWPFHLDDGTPHARDDLETITRISPPVPVTVRLEWAGGVEWHRGTAERWANGSTFVAVDDKRLAIRAVWVADEDVRRRE